MHAPPTPTHIDQGSDLIGHVVHDYFKKAA